MAMKTTFVVQTFKIHRKRLMPGDRNPKPPGKLGAEKLTPEEQRRRIIEAAQKAGASEDEADFDAAFKRIAKPPQNAPKV